MNDPATLTSAVSPSVDEGPVAEPFGHPTDTFDVEPPYTPDAAAIEAVEKYDDRFIDREISWVRFNQRVLELAEDPGLPLLERARFLAIFASNLDEFFMVRVAGLKRRIAAGVAVRAASGMMPREHDGTPVGREIRLIVVAGAMRQLFGHITVDGLQPQRARHAVDHVLAIGGNTHVAQHAHGELVRVDLLWKPQGIVERLFDPGGEGDRRAPPGGRIHPPDLSLTPDDQRAAVGHPRVLRVDAMDRPCLLEVLVQVGKQLAIAPALEIAQEQGAAQPDAPHVSERLPVGRHLRRDRAALHAHGATLAAGAFADAHGLLSVNQSAGAGNAQANLFAVSRGGMVSGLDDAVLADVAGAASASADAAAASSSPLREASIAEGAFHGGQGVLQLNQTAGADNASANAIVLRLPGGLP